jgi:hypothetical protein
VDHPLGQCEAARRNPDTVTRVYDSTRDLGIVMPGLYFITRNSPSQCPGITESADSMTFDFSTNTWQLLPYGPPPNGSPRRDTHRFRGVFHERRQQQNTIPCTVDSTTSITSLRRYTDTN